MLKLKKIVLLCLLVSLKWANLQRVNYKVYEDLIEATLQEARKRLFLQYSNSSSVRRQREFPKSLPFPCQNATRFGRSPTRPNSVHRLRPGDIDVVAAMGDSLVAGNGAMEDFALGNMIESRGVSWCIGGDGTWHQFVTLPNILKEFNPNITGYSTGIGEFTAPNSGLNTGFPVAADADALKQAHILVDRIRKNHKIDFDNDWKMVTVFFGANDLCSAQCFDAKRGSPYNHAVKLSKALDYLQRHLPRTFVNLIPVIDVTVSVRLKRSLMCRLMHSLYCTCYRKTKGDPVDELSEITRKYQQAEEIMISSGRYDQKEDFTVVIQPFIKYFNTPRNHLLRQREAIDISFITHDCFHFSQKGHALGANMLWNNLLQPVGLKSTTMINGVMRDFLCPSKNAPYFFTNKNSKTFFETGHQ